MGQGDARLTLDWQHNFYSLHVEVDGLAGIFDVEGDLVFRKGVDIALLAEAEVVIPEFVPFIGGDKIGGLGFFFEHVFSDPISTTFAAWIDLHIIFWDVEVGFEIVIDSSGASHSSLIGAGTIDGFKQAVMPPVDKTYTFTAQFERGANAGQVPLGATSIVVGADWSRSAAGVTFDNRPTFRVTKTPASGQPQTFTEDQFEANGIKLISDSTVSGPTSQAIQIVGSTIDPYTPLDSDYTLLVDITTDGGNPFPHYPNIDPRVFPDVLKIDNTYYIPKPTLGPPGAMSPTVPLVPPKPTADFSVTLEGAMDEAFISQAKISLYQVQVSDPFQRAVLVGKVAPTQIDPSGNNGQTWRANFTVPIEGLFQTQYVLYAVVDDGFNVPIQSGNSAAFSPDFAVDGLVSNQNNDPQGGWSVFLDYNRNGAQDPKEPGTRTNAGGFYSFTRTFAPGTGWDAVPVGTPLNVQLTVPAPANYVIQNSMTVTFDGTTTVNTPFSLRERSAIKGTVFEDSLNNGVAADGQPITSAVVYLDANGNGVRDAGEPQSMTDTRGRYDFASRAAGTYTVALDLASLSDAAPITAYDVPAGTVGEQTNLYTYGMQFTVDEPVQLTSLGVFDSGQDGLQRTLTAVLYDADTQAILAQLTFTAGDSGTLQDGSRFKPLAQPLVLLPGFHGIIAAYGYGPGEPAGNAFYLPGGKVPWTTHDGNGRLDFIRGVFAPTAGNFPTVGDSSPRPNPYAAGSFEFSEFPWKLSGPTPASYSVTIDSSGFDLQENKDFGALPPGFIAGSIAGHPLDSSGGVQQNTQPQAGVTVQLMQDAFVGGIDAGGEASGSYVADAGFSGGTAGTATGQIDTSRVFQPAPQAVYLSNRHGSEFTYTITGLTPAAPYAVRLHFAEPAFGGPRLRLFDVAVNGVTVLDDYDVFGESGGRNVAIAPSFDTFADAGGHITIRFFAGAASEPFVNGIELLRPGSVAATTTTDAEGRYVFRAYAPGPYTVQEVPPAGWRQLSPFHSDLVMSETPFAQGQGSHSLATADYDNDGYVDLAWQVAAQSGFSAPIQVAYNQKNGAFAAPVAYYPADDGDVLLTGDLNNDHLPDLVALGFGEELSVLLNTGNSDPAQRFQFVAGYWSIPPALEGKRVRGHVTGDLNKDGYDELLLCYVDGQTDSHAGVAVFWGAASASGRTVTTYPLPASDSVGTSQAGGVAVGDLNGDGNPDVLAAGGGIDPAFQGLSVAFGDGKGGLTPWTEYLVTGGFFGGPVALGDIQGKGSVDAALMGVSVTNQPSGNSYAVRTRLNRGDGTFDADPVVFNQTTFPTVPIATQMLLEDLNGDLKPDLALLKESEPFDIGTDGFVVFANIGVFPYFDLSAPLWFPLPGGGSTFFAGDFAAADVNNDGLNDVIVVNAASNQPGAVFVNQSPQNQPGVPVTLSAGQVFDVVDFVNVQKPAGAGVHGVLFEDANRNGAKDTGETGTAGSFVFVDLDRNGRYDPGEPSATTIEGGAFAISGLVVGGYRVGVVAEDDWKVVSPPEAFVEVAVDAMTAVQVDFGRVHRLIRPVADQSVESGKLLSVTVQLASGAVAGRRWAFSLEPGSPAGAAIDPVTGQFTWTPDVAAGQYPITLRVHDPFQPRQAETATFLVTVGGADRMLTIPADGRDGDWTVRLHQTNLEVRDRRGRLVHSELSAGLNSLTILDADRRPNRLTLDLRKNAFSLPGGITWMGGGGRGDSLEILLGAGDDVLSVQDTSATIGGGPDVFWSRIESMSIDAAGGDDRLSLNGQPVAGGSITLLGGKGHDTYVLATRHSTVRIDDGKGADTLDFSGSSTGVRVNLSKDKGQLQSIGGGNLLAIQGAIENVFGTALDDVLQGNDRDNTLRGLGGDDVLEGAAGNDLLDGGDGDDVLRGGKGDDILLGGEGDDRLSAATGHNLLIGGPGADRLLAADRGKGNGGILIGGSTAFDANEPALRAILAEWSSSRSLVVRIANLTDGSGSKKRLNGDLFLDATTRIDDGAADLLLGDSRNDSFLPPFGDRVCDGWRSLRCGISPAAPRWQL